MGDRTQHAPYHNNGKNKDTTISQLMTHQMKDTYYQGARTRVMIDGDDE
jgi:hypothetical protein